MMPSMERSGQKRLTLRFLQALADYEHCSEWPDCRWVGGNIQTICGDGSKPVLTISGGINIH